MCKLSKESEIERARMKKKIIISVCCRFKAISKSIEIKKLILYFILVICIGFRCDVHDNFFYTVARMAETLFVFALPTCNRKINDKPFFHSSIHLNPQLKTENVFKLNKNYRFWQSALDKRNKKKNKKHVNPKHVRN